jgi:hypothetical protein
MDEIKYKATSVRHDFIEELSRAASFDAGNSYPQLFQLLGYRKRMAEMMLHIDYENTPDIKEEYEYINNQIKKLLGL